MRRDPSLRHLPQSESSGVAPWTANRWILVGTWAACCALLVVLLFTEAQFLPVVATKGVNKVVAAADFSRYFKAGSNPARSSQLQSRPTEANATGTSAAVDLNQLWGALPFTPVLRDNITAYEYEYDTQDDAGQQTSRVSKPHSDADQQQRMLAPLQQPPVANPGHADLAYMAALVAEVIDASITPEEGKSGFKTAFEGTKPPEHSTWHIRSPLASNWQHKQQKGAEYQEANGFESSSSTSRGIKGNSGSQTDDSRSTSTASSSHSSSSSLARQDQEQQRQQLEEDERSSRATQAAAKLMSYALRLLKDSNRLAACGTEDDSLPLPPVAGVGGPPGGRVLLAYTVHNSEAAMPNFVLQVVQFAMQAVPGSLFVSIFESGSTDQTAFWLDVLKLLLLPLRVPALFTAGGDLHSRSNASVVECRASMHNMAIDAFFPTAGTVQCPSYSSNTAGADDSSTSSDRPHGMGRAAWELLTNSSSAHSFLHETVQQLQPGMMHMAAPGQQQRQPPLPKLSRKLRSSINNAPQLLTQAGAPASAVAIPGSAVMAGPTVATVAPENEAASNTHGALYGISEAVAAAAAVTVDMQAANWVSEYQDPSRLSNSSSNAVADALFATESAGFGEISSSSSSSKHAGFPKAGGDLGSSSRRVMFETAPQEDPLLQLAACFHPDWVIFIDSGVFFCKSDLHRLLMHKTADMACGMDLKLAEPGSTSSVAVTDDRVGADDVQTAAEPPNAAAAAAPAANGASGKRLVAATDIAQQSVDNSLLNAAVDAPKSTVLESQQQQQEQQELQLLVPDLVSAMLEQAHQQSQQRKPELLLPDVLRSSTAEQHQQHRQQQRQDVLIGVMSRHELQTLTVEQQQQQQQEDEQFSALQQYHIADMHETQGDYKQQQLEMQQQTIKQLTSTPRSSSSSMALPAPPARPVNPTLAKYPFYYGDYGVGRMVTGGLLDAVPPYAGAHTATVRRISAGLPVQVYCCWNGLAKLRAEPFRHGLRFRANMDSECKTSDKALMCDDFHRLGFSKALVDSGILVTHQVELSARISNTIKHANRMPYVRRSRWVEVQGGGSPWLRNELQLRQQTYPALVCCDSQDAGFASNEHALYNMSTIASAAGDQTKNEQVLGCGYGMGSGFLMSHQDLVTGGGSGWWRLGATDGEQQCQAVRPLAINHTDTFLRQRQQQHHLDRVTD